MGRQFQLGVDVCARRGSQHETGGHNSCCSWDFTKRFAKDLIHSLRLEHIRYSAVLDHKWRRTILYKDEAYPLYTARGLGRWNKTLLPGWGSLHLTAVYQLYVWQMDSLRCVQLYSDLRVRNRWKTTWFYPRNFKRSIGSI